MTSVLDQILSGFDQFDLDDRLRRATKAAGFESPRPIQMETIPAGRDGYDVLGLAQTGTGKTAAFGLALLHRLLSERRKGPRALILAPTRELAAQITEEIRMLSQFTKLTMVTVYGGVSLNNQVKALMRHPDIVVGLSRARVGPD